MSEVLLAPSERAVVDVWFDQPGRLQLEHRTPDRVYPLAAVTVRQERAAPSVEPAFQALRHAPELAAERQRLDAHLAAPPDKTLALVAEMDDPAVLQDGDGAVVYACPMHPEVTSDQPGRCPKCGMKLLVTPAAGHDPAATPPAQEPTQDHRHGTADGIEWEDDMVQVNRLTTEATMHWKLVDQATSAANADIDWHFQVGDRVKIRLVNEMDSDHPMHHPIHFHGAGRFLVLARGGVTEPNLVWKDTVLVRTGQTVDILFDVTNPGVWMAHCHISEHLQSGMMLSFHVASTVRG